MEAHDVIIVGAGPAGLSTALHLERMAPHLAVRTLILEKARHPRPKPCGGGVLQDGVLILHSLGLDFSEVPQVKAQHTHFQWDERGATLVGFDIVVREEFDSWLAEKAKERGIIIRESEPVKRVIPSEDGVEVQTPNGSYRAKVVVGADGAHSVVRRSIAGKRRWTYSRALVLWTPPPPEPSLHRTDRTYFDFIAIAQGIPGYIWDFPILLRGQPMRCWGIYDARIGSPRTQPLQKLLAQWMARHGYRLEDYPLQGSVIPHFDPKGVFSAPRILLVGDAAGTDPLFGEGISPALGYGQLAAQAIIEAFEKGDFTFRDYRDRLLRSNLGMLLRRRRAIAHLLFHIHSVTFHRLLWWRLGPLVEWTTNRWLANWFKESEAK